MANSAASGRVVDELGTPYADLIVGAFETGGIFGDRLLPNTANPTDPLFADYARTAADGGFRLSYTAGTYDLQVRVFDNVKRLLAQSDVARGTASDTYVLPTPIIVPHDTAEGWLANGGQFTKAVAGNSIDLLIDNHVAWRDIIDAINAATVSINFMLFFLDVGVTLMDFNPDMPNIAIGTGAPTPGDRLETVLRAAGERGVQVRLLCNDFMAGKWNIPSADSAGPVQRWFTTPPALNVEVRRFETPLYTPIHTKFVIIDAELHEETQAFVIGSPFIQDYYDEFTHRIEDPRHGTYWTFSASQIQVPTHDVSLRVRGPAIGELNQTFCLHWNRVKPASAADLAPEAAPAARPDNVSVQVTRTLHGNGRFPAVPHGETTIAESYLRAIKNAQDYIYLENQYFTCDPIADALILALKQKPQLQLIFLTNNKVDISGYQRWHPGTIRKVLAGLTETERERVGFFTRWSHEQGAQPNDPTRILRNYIHSKVAVIDDKWATVGSANLDGVSLTASDHASASRSLWWWLLGSVAGLRSDGTTTEIRASETNLVLLNAIASQPATSLPGDLRRRLWAEHLGFTEGTGAPDPGNSALAARPAEGWLRLWNHAAAAKGDGLSPIGPGPIEIHPATVLRYPVDYGDPSEQLEHPERYPEVRDMSHPGAYLTRLGVDTDRIKVLDSFRKFTFKTSEWQ